MRIKYLTIGLIAGALLATAGTSLAAPLIEKVTASLRPDYKIEVDGKSVELENPPLIYDGSSYLPVREVGSIIGKDVVFEDGTIKLTSKEDATLNHEWIALRDLAIAQGLESGYISDIESHGLKKGDQVILKYSVTDGYAESPEGQVVQLQVTNGAAYLLIEDLRKVGIIQ